jgi:pyruvate/2-oxoglutarate dehydrogenase complex dihydrolipoamide acyltransferase (E2) component
MSNGMGVNLSPQGIGVADTIPLRGQIKMLAEHMSKSHAQYAAFTNMGEVDAAEFQTFRDSLSSQIAEVHETQPSFTHLMIKIIGRCLVEHPSINCTLDGNRILVLSEINIGFAVALPNGMLIVPVVKHVDEKSLQQITEEANVLASKARNRQLTVDDVTGGTFTITNAGMYQHKNATSTGNWSTPLITIPQSAILGLGALYKKPVVRNGEISIRTMLPTSFTIDYRVINGVPAIEFMNTFYRYIEEPQETGLAM